MANWSILDRDYSSYDDNPYYQEREENAPAPCVRERYKSPSPILTLLLSPPTLCYRTPKGETPREIRNKLEKQRRDRMNQSIQHLASIVPNSKPGKKLNKREVLQLAAHYLRAHQYVFGSSIDRGSEFSLNFSEALVKNLKGFLITTTYKGIFVVVSPNVEEYLGYTEVQLIGQNIFDIIHKDDHQILRYQLYPRCCTLTQTGELPIPKDVDAVKKISDALANDRRSFVVRFRKLKQQKSEPPQYVPCHVEGSFRKADNAGRRKQGVHMGRRMKSRGENISSSGNDIVFIGMVRPNPDTFINESGLESFRMEYRTRHSIDGEIIQCEQRIALVTGYMTHEVSGVNAMHFMHRDDVRWVIFALRQMYDQHHLVGESCYRLMTKNGQFIYMRTLGWLDVDQISKAVTSFVCINTVVAEEEGKELIKLMKKKFHLMINNKEESKEDEEELSEPENERQTPPVEDPKQLEKVILHLVTNLPSPRTDDRLYQEPLGNAGTSSHLAIIPPKKEKIHEAIEKSYSVIRSCCSKMTGENRDKKKPKRPTPEESPPTQQNCQNLNTDANSSSMTFYRQTNTHSINRPVDAIASTSNLNAVPDRTSSINTRMSPHYFNHYVDNWSSDYPVPSQPPDDTYLDFATNDSFSLPNLPDTGSDFDDLSDDINLTPLDNSNPMYKPPPTPPSPTPSLCTYLTPPLLNPLLTPHGQQSLYMPLTPPSPTPQLPPHRLPLLYSPITPPSPISPLPLHRQRTLLIETVTSEPSIVCQPPIPQPPVHSQPLSPSSPSVRRPPVPPLLPLSLRPKPSTSKNGGKKTYYSNSAASTSGIKKKQQNSNEENVKNIKDNEEPEFFEIMKELIRNEMLRQSDPTTQRPINPQRLAPSPPSVPGPPVPPLVPLSSRRKPSTSKYGGKKTCYCNSTASTSGIKRKQQNNNVENEKKIKVNGEPQLPKDNEEMIWELFSRQRAALDSAIQHEAIANGYRAIQPCNSRKTNEKEPNSDYPVTSPPTYDTYLDFGSDDTFSLPSLPDVGSDLEDINDDINLIPLDNSNPMRTSRDGGKKSCYSDPAASTSGQRNNQKNKEKVKKIKVNDEPQLPKEFEELIWRQMAFNATLERKGLVPRHDLFVWEDDNETEEFEGLMDSMERSDGISSRNFNEVFHIMQFNGESLEESSEEDNEKDDEETVDKETENKDPYEFEDDRQSE